MSFDIFFFFTLFKLLVNFVVCIIKIYYEFDDFLFFLLLSFIGFN